MTEKKKFCNIDDRSTPIGANFSVPDSCCHEPHEGCGRGIFSQSPDQIRNKIFVNGCMTLLKDQLESDVLPMMIVYACVGVILALVELITVVLASAYVAQINRRRRREEKTWRINVDDRVPMPRAFFHFVADPADAIS
jgi:hypothetical protein